MKRSRTIPQAVAWVIIAAAVCMTLIAGWHREMLSRYPLSGLPFVDTERIRSQVVDGNVSRTEAIFYRKDYAGADTTENR